MKDIVLLFHLIPFILGAVLAEISTSIIFRFVFLYVCLVFFFYNI